MRQFRNFLQTIIPLPNKEFEESITFFTEGHLHKGDIFVQQDKICNQVAFIKKGTLRTYYLNDKGEEITSCFCTENSLSTSYRSFILQEPSELILQAIEDTDLLIINYSDLQHLYSKSPLWQNMGRLLSEREYLTMEKYATVLNNDSAKEKYQRLLKEQPAVIQKAKLEDIASYLGVTRRTLSRIRKELIN